MPVIKNILTKSEYMADIFKNVGEPQQRIMIGVPLTGLVRVEWMFARYGQVIPCNWAHADLIQMLDQFSPLQHTVADARNIIANEAVKQNYEWLFFIDHDTIIPQGTILKLNERMINNPVPVLSGLYFTKSVPSEPLMYRDLGRGYYADWKIGDDVWVGAIPMGCALINVKLLKVMYDEADEYVVNGRTLKRIFETPSKVIYEVNSLNTGSLTGTEDINWCSKVINNNVFEKAGFPEYKNKKYPFLVDTSIFCRHIDQSGRQFPINGEEYRFLPKHLKVSREEFIARLKERFNMITEQDEKNRNKKPVSRKLTKKKKIAK